MIYILNYKLKNIYNKMDRDRERRMMHHMMHKPHAYRDDRFYERHHPMEERGGK